jgi:hypothetical protein
MVRKSRAHNPPGSTIIFTHSHWDQALQLRDFPLLPDLVKAGACGLRVPSVTEGNASHGDGIVYCTFFIVKLR